MMVNKGRLNCFESDPFYGFLWPVIQLGELLYHLPIDDIDNVKPPSLDEYTKPNLGCLLLV